ncbi:HEPN domain-containing protein [archaeon]|jgi:uncharacterized protein (UPF0332 family)|nr:HEPN domain-containing protein [archaeon]
MKKSIIKILLKQGRGKLVEHSLEISKSYSFKSQGSFESGKILLKNKLYEDSIFMFYYSMYNSLLSLLFYIGVKSENHNFSIFLLNYLFGRKDLSELIFLAKKERINNQYYVNGEKDINFLKSKVKNLFEDSEEFILEIKALIINLNKQEIIKLRKKFKEL